MQHFSKQKQLYADYGTIVMETRDHFKNGASLKSRKSRGNLISKILCYVMLVMTIMNVISCSDDNDKLDTETNNSGIGEATSTTDPGVVINGVRWATRNVDASGTFAATPESYGKLYQWNRKKAWDVIGNVSDWDSSTPTGTEWESANDPSPTGWRVPTFEEIQTLLNTEKVTSKWTTQNGVNGRQFTDKITGNNIFLPAAGFRGYSNDEIGGTTSDGDYWSSTQRDASIAYILWFNTGSTVWSFYNRGFAFSVRCVLENKDDPTSVQMQSAQISGAVHDLNGNSLAGVKVTSGTISATTAADGTFAFNQVQTTANRAVMKFEKAGYFTLTRSGVKSNEMYVKAILTSKSNSTISTQTTFDSGSEKIIAVGGMKVKIPASSLVRANGSSYSGSVKADILYLDPNNEKFAEMMPGGDLAGLRTNNSEVQLISYGMTEVTFTDNAGNPLQLAQGKVSELTFPIPQGMGSNPPAEIPLWHFNDEKGIWVEDGVATRQGNVYVGTVKHFSWVNLDIPAPSVTIKGKITDCERKPVIYMNVNVRLTSGNNYTSSYTNSQGEYTVRVPSNTPITISVNSGNDTKSYDISSKASGSVITQDFSVPCGEGGTENPNEQFAIEKASIKYLQYASTLLGPLNGRIPDSYESKYSQSNPILTFDNYGKRARMDTRGIIRIWDSFNDTQMTYGTEGWNVSKPCALYYDWGNDQKGYNPYYYGDIYDHFRIGSAFIPTSEIFRDDAQTTTKNIAGKTCTIYTYRWSSDPEEYYWRFGYWNGILLLSENNAQYPRETIPDGKYIVFVSVAQKIVTDVPSNAFDKTVEVAWME
jgi:uncharacterized protein (TIGR02145 family)